MIVNDLLSFEIVSDWRNHCVGGMKVNRPGGVSMVINWNGASCRYRPCVKDSYIIPMGIELGHFLALLNLNLVYIVAQSLSGSLIIIGAYQQTYQQHEF